MTVIVFLGIEIDTVKGVIRLPEEKLRRLQREIRTWRGRRVCTKQELLSLIGQLQHAGGQGGEDLFEEDDFMGWTMGLQMPCHVTGYHPSGCRSRMQARSRHRFLQGCSRHLW